MCVFESMSNRTPQDHKTAHLCFSLCPFFVSLFFSCLASFYIFLRLSSEFRILTCELRSPTLQVAALFFWWWIGAGGGWCHTVNWKWKTVMQIRRTTTKNPNHHQQLSQKESGISKRDGFIPLFVCHSSCWFLNILTFATVCKTKLPKKTVRYEMATHFSFAPAISHFPLWSCHRGMDCFIRSQADSGLLSQR